MTSTTVFDLHGIETSALAHGHPDFTGNVTLNDSFNPLHASTPTIISRQSKQEKNRPLRILNVNFRSAVGKVAEIATMLDCTKPDIIVGTETGTDASITDREMYLPPYLQTIQTRPQQGGRWWADCHG